jgi:hypothetical protein
LAELVGREKDAVHATGEAVVRMRGASEAYRRVGESHRLPGAKRRIAKTAELEEELVKLKR